MMKAVFFIRFFDVDVHTAVRLHPGVFDLRTVIQIQKRKKKNPETVAVVRPPPLRGISLPTEQQSRSSSAILSEGRAYQWKTNVHRTLNGIAVRTRKFSTFRAHFYNSFLFRRQKRRVTEFLWEKPNFISLVRRWAFLPMPTGRPLPPPLSAPAAAAGS